MSRDRTAEFAATVKSIAGKPQYLNQQANNNANINHGTYNQSALSNPQSVQFANYTEFMRGSRSIAKELYFTYQKLEKINLLAQKKTIFDDEESSRELNELIYTVKQDIRSFNQQIEQLRQKQMESLQSNRAKNANSHTKNVVLNLQQKLASISSSFKSTLELRTENMKKQKQRREQFTTSSSSVNSPLLSRAIHQTPIVSNSNHTPGQGPNNFSSPSPATLPTPSQQSSTLLLSHNTPTSGQQQQRSTTVIEFGDQGPGQDAGQLRQRSVPQQQQQQALLQFQDQTDQYIEDRANTMQSIESTIVELGSIFSQLTTLVHQQEEMITRIDANVSDTMMNVDAAHESLLQYLQSVTSNRWLMLKIFGVLFGFFILFVLLF